MSFIEFQVSTASFLGMQQVALQQRQLCPPAPMTFGGVEFRVDHIEFGANSIRHSVPSTADIVHDEFGVPKSGSVDGFVTQIAQRVTVFVDSTADFLAHPNQTPPGIFSIGLTAVLSLAYYPIDDQCYLRAVLNANGLEFDPFPPLPAGIDPNQLKQTLTNLITPLFPSPAINFSFANALTNAAVNVQNADVSVGGGGAFLSFRAQLGDLDAAVAEALWHQFLQGNITDRRGGADWVLFFPKAYLEQFFELQVEQGLTAVPSKFDLISGGTTYFNFGGKVQLSTDLNGNVHLPDPFTTKYISVVVNSVLSVAAPNTLQIELNLPSDADLVNSFLGPFAGTLRMLGPFGMSLQGLAESVASSAIPPLKNPNCTKVTPTQYRCTRVLQPPALPTGSAIKITSLVGQDDGVAFGGQMNAVPLTPPVLSITIHEYKWRPPKVNCSSDGVEIVAAFANSPTSFATAHGSVFLDNSGTTPVSFCGNPEVRNDPTGAFPPASIKSDSPVLPAQITIDAPVPSSAYYAAPYTCDLLITTTGGVRLVRLMPAPVLTREDIVKLEGEILAELVNCEQLVDPWTRLHGGFNPHWTVDPPVERAVDHIWQIAVTGLPQGETISLVDASGKEQMRAAAQPSETMNLSARLSPAGDKELTLLRSGNTALRSESSRTRVSVGSKLLIKAATVPLPASCRDFRFTPSFARKGIAAVSDNSVFLFELFNPFRPRLLRYWNGSGIRGTFALGRRLIAFGDGGFQELAETGRLQPAGATCGCRRILDAVVRSGVAYALTDRGLEVYNSSLCRIAELPARVTKESVLILNGNRLFLGGTAGLSVYDLSDIERPAELASKPDLHVSRLGVPPVASQDSIVAVLPDGTALHLRFKEKGWQELASFRESPWFLQNVRIGKVLVTVGQGRKHLDIAVLGNQVTT